MEKTPFLQNSNLDGFKVRERLLKVKCSIKGKGVENLAQKSGKCAFEKITDEKWYAVIGLKKA